MVQVKQRKIDTMQISIDELKTKEEKYQTFNRLKEKSFAHVQSVLEESYPSDIWKIAKYKFYPLAEPPSVVVNLRLNHKESGEMVMLNLYFDVEADDAEDKA